MIDFEAMKREAQRGTQILINYHDCLGWNEFGDKGNACYNPFEYSSQAECDEEALWLAAVKSTMKKNSYTHKLLAELVAKDIGCAWVTYDWLCKSMSRIFNGQSMDALINMCCLSKNVKIRMKENGITSINSLEEVSA